MEAMGMVPWLDQPVMLHSDRDPGECTMTPEQCAYKTRYWVFWYQADHRYALPTVAFFMVAIGLFAIGNWVSAYAPKSAKKTALWRRSLAVFRLLSYRNWRIAGWNTQSVGALLLVGAGLTYFLAMTLGPHPYYWPNTKEISYGNSPPIATRTGFLALACMPFLFVLGAKANPITALTSISSEKLNVWHNWVAWAMYVLALIHTFPFIVFHMWKGDIVEQWNMGGVWVTGVVALLAQTWLTLLSIPWIRNRYYEFFKAGHYIAALVFIIFFFFHCDFRMSSWDYFIATAVLYVLCWAYSQCRTYFEHGIRHRARLVLETDQTLKISIDTDTAWSPGQHMYLRFLTGGLHTLSIHPFTICSVSRIGRRNTLVFYVRPRGGITGRLRKLAVESTDAQVPVLMDGPYGGIHCRYSAATFEQSIVIGGGAGAGFTLSVVEDFILRAGDAEKFGSTMKVIIATRDAKLRGWFMQALSDIAGRYPEHQRYIRIDVHIHETGLEGTSTDAASQAAVNITSLSSKEAVLKSTTDEGTGDMFNITYSSGRPDLPAEIKAVIDQEGVSSVGIVVCGPSSMDHDVATAAAAAQHEIISGRSSVKEVFLHQESFTY